MAERISVTGNAERLKALGFVSDPVPPAPDLVEEEEDFGQTVLSELGMENAPIEEKARVIADAWLGTLTKKDLRKMGASGADKIAKIAGLGGSKRPDPSSNPIIMAIIFALKNLGVKAPELRVIEADPPTLESK